MPSIPAIRRRNRSSQSPPDPVPTRPHIWTIVFKLGQKHVNRQGFQALFRRNSPVPNRKPCPIRRDQDWSIAITYVQVAAPGSVFEIDANSAPVLQCVPAAPNRAIIGVGVPVCAISIVARLRAIMELDDLARQKRLHSGAVQYRVAVSDSFLRQGRSREHDKKKGKAHICNLARQFTYLPITIGGGDA